MWSKEEGEQHTERGSTEEKHEEGGTSRKRLGWDCWLFHDNAIAR